MKWGASKPSSSRGLRLFSRSNFSSKASPLVKRDSPTTRRAVRLGRRVHKKALLKPKRAKKDRRSRAMASKIEDLRRLNNKTES